MSAEVSLGSNLDALIDQYVTLLNANVQPEEFRQLNRGITSKLFQGFPIYNIISFLYPDYTYTTVIYIHDIGYSEYNSSDIFAPLRYDSKWFGLKLGARISFRDVNRFRECLIEGESHGNSIAVELQYMANKESYHSAILWFDTSTKVIDLYDPGIDTKDMFYTNVALHSFFTEILPEYTYNRNTTDWHRCIQNIILTERGYSDSFCTYYSWLYAIHRMNGYSHEDTERHLLEHRHSLQKEIVNLIHRMVDIAHKYAEMINRQI